MKPTPAMIAYGPDEHAVYIPSFDDLTRAVDDYVSANDIPRWRRSSSNT